MPDKLAPWSKSGGTIRSKFDLFSLPMPAEDYDVRLYAELDGFGEDIPLDPISDAQLLEALEVQEKYAAIGLNFDPRKWLRQTPAAAGDISPVDSNGVPASPQKRPPASTRAAAP